MKTPSLPGSLLVLCSGAVCASESEPQSTRRGLLGFIPFVRDNPCGDDYRQLAASIPVHRFSEDAEGHVWRALYGYCVAEKGRFALHQDWVVSYLDANPLGDAAGGDGASLGTDFSIQWQAEMGWRVAPYIEAGGGVQYAFGTAFPADASRFQFTLNFGVGVLVPVRNGAALNGAVRYIHLSNANALPKNSGYDALHLMFGVRW